MYTGGELNTLVTHLVAAGGDPEVRAVVLTGEGRAFSAGVDLKALRAESTDDGDVGELVNSRAREVIRLLTTLPKVVVAKVNGFCFTGADADAWGLAVRAVPLAELDTAVAELLAAVVANSPGSLAAYKDLYREALDVGLSDGLAYEAATSYPIKDSARRLAAFG